MDFSKNVFVVVGDNDKRENFENVTLGECDEIKIGMQVRSKEGEYNLYNEYAFKKGDSTFETQLNKSIMVLLGNNNFCVQNKVLKSLKAFLMLKCIII